MGESSSKSVISVNSNQRSVTVPEEKTRAVLVSDNIQQKSNLNDKGSRVKLTLQDYRKQVGLKVINQKSTQKIGITAKSEANLEEKCHGQSLFADSANCPHCGFTTSSTNKCLRCMRVFEKEKMVHISSDLDPDQIKSSGISQMSKDSSYGNRRPRTQNAQPSRQTRAKFEEPQCVTLSSDEDYDSFQETKKLKCDNTHKPSENSYDEASNASLVNSPVETEEKGGSNDLLRWKEGGLSGPFFAVNCRSVRIGSYKFHPGGRVLFSSEGIMLQAPVFHTFNQPSGNSGIWINVVIPAQQLLQVDAHFKRQLPVIFLDATPNMCRSVCKELGLLKSAGPYWDYLSDEESKKHLTLWPSNLDDSAKNAIKRAFVPKGVFREITHIEANRRLVISSPREVRDAIAKLTTFHTDSSKDSSKQSGKLPTTSYWCHMKGTLKEIDFEWKIDRLAFFNDVGLWEPLTSTEFGQHKEHKFRLSLVVDGSNLQIKLLCSTSFVNPRRVEVAILNDNGKKIFQNAVGIAAVERFPVKVFEISKNAFLESGNFVCGEITIYCKISTFIREELTGESTATKRYLCKTPTGDHSEDLQKREELFVSMDLSDVIFNVCGRQFTAHKIILAMKSPVFKAMFHHSSNKEVLPGQVKVEDIEPDVFQEILLFIYTGRTQLTAMNKMAPGILAAADKYLLEDLKTRCETHLIRQMSAENCLELLSLATHHPAEHLKKYANEYLRRFPDNVMKTDKWIKMKEENPSALFELLEIAFGSTSTAV